MGTFCANSVTPSRPRFPHHRPDFLEDCVVFRINWPLQPRGLCVPTALPQWVFVPLLAQPL